MTVDAYGKALGKFRGLASQVSALDDRIAVVTQYRDGLLAKRDRAASVIPLTEREQRMWQNKIDCANGTIEALNTERRALFGARER